MRYFKNKNFRKYFFFQARMHGLLTRYQVLTLSTVKPSIIEPWQPPCRLGKAV